MPTIRKTTTIPAGQAAHPLQGSQYEFLPWPALVEFVALVTADGDVECTIFTGSDVLLEPSPIDIRGPSEPINMKDDVIVSDVVGGGERIGVTLRNTHASEPRTVRTVVNITPA